MNVRAPILILGIALQLAVLTRAPAQIGTPPVIVAQLTNPAPSANAHFGNSVAALDSSRLLVGAYNANLGAAGAGGAYLFNINGSVLTAFTNPTPTSGDQFGNAVAALGTNRVLVAADAANIGTNGAGAAYLFKTNGVLLTTFTNPVPKLNANFGSTLAALGSDRVIVGAIYANTDSVTKSGAGYLFNTNGLLLATFTNPAPTFNDQFGTAVAAVGFDRIVIGAPQDDVGANNSGAAYLFNTNGAVLATFVNPVPTAFGSFANSVAAVGPDRILIGAYGNTSTFSSSGAAYLFDTNGTLITTFTNPAPAANEFFGNVVAAVSTNMLLIGAYYVSTNTPNARFVYLFNTNGTLLAGFTNAGNSDLSANSLAVIGTDKVLIGAPLDDAGATDSGSAYLYQLPVSGTLPRLDQMQVLGMNRFQFRVSGVINQSYTVQFATQLTNWADLLTTNNTTTNVFIVTDPTASNASRAYRLRVN